MKSITVGGRIVKTSRIESVRLDGTYGNASVWIIGRPEPLYSASPEEFAAVQRYVSEAMF